MAPSCPGDNRIRRPRHRPGRSPSRLVPAAVEERRNGLDGVCGALPAMIASRASNAAGNHGSSRRSCAISSRTSPVIVMPTAITLGVIRASLPTQHDQLSARGKAAEVPEVNGVLHRSAGKTDHRRAVSEHLVGNLGPVMRGESRHGQDPVSGVRAEQLVPFTGRRPSPDAGAHHYRRTDAAAGFGAAPAGQQRGRRRVTPAVPQAGQPRRPGLV